ncbi:autotransporter-associated beta strand repeat-containing protein [Sphingomonas sp. GlSt437]
MAAARDAILRNALLASTALVGVSIATPVAAQTVTPAGGSGTIVGGGGSTTDQTGSGGGLRRYNLPSGASVTVNGVSIQQTTTGPTVNALSIEVPSGSNGLGVTINGTNNISTTVTGGAAVAISNPGNMGVSFTTGGSTFTGSYGFNINNPNGYVAFHSDNLTQHFVASGSAVTGINISAQLNPEAYLGNSTISGFATGVHLSTTDTRQLYAYVKSTGGSISATQVGIDLAPASNSVGAVDSQSAITAPIGIRVTGGAGATITTGGTGTIDAISSGSGTGILTAGTDQPTTITVGAAIGGTTAFRTGVDAESTGTGTVTVTNNAAINASGAGIYAVSGAASGNAVNVNANVTGGGIGLAAINTVGQGFTVTVGTGATVTASGTNSRALRIQAGDGIVVNHGTITNSTANAGSAIEFLQAGNVTNTGTISSVGSAIGIYSSASLTLDNSGTIAAGATGIYVGGGAASITNRSGGSITGNGGNNGAVAIALVNSGSTAINTLDLQAGSTTGSIYSVAGGTTNVTLAGTLTGAYSGAFATGAVNWTLASTGSMGAATFGSANDSFTWQGGTIGGLIDAGGGTNNFYSSLGAGNSATLDLSNLSNFQLFTHQSGTATLAGNAASAGIAQINAGTGSPAGMLIFSGTTGLTGGISVNGAIIRATSAGAFGTGTITAIDPTIQYGATGTYSNNIVLASNDTVNDPTRIQVDSGIAATLTGQITQSGATAQPLIFDGLGTAILTNGANNYAGLTTISNGTVVESNTASALGSGGVTINSGAVLQFDNQTGGDLYIKAGTYSGNGTIRFTGTSNGYVSLGNAGVVTFTLGSGGLIDIQSGNVAGSASVQGFWTGNLANLNVASGAVFDGVEGNIYVNVLTGTGTIRNGYHGLGSLTIGVDNGSGTFDGTLQNNNIPNSTLVLIKTGTGTQTLTGNNTYTGSTTISGGMLALGGNGTLGSTEITNNAAFDISGHTGGVSILNLLGTGTTTLGGNTLTISSASGTYSGSFTGTGGLVKQGSGTYALTGTSSFSGGTTIQAGTLQAYAASLGAGDAHILSGATLELNQPSAGTYAGNIDGAGSINVTSIGRTTLNGTISTTGQLSVNGSNALLTIGGTRSGATNSAVALTGTSADLTVALGGLVQGGQYLGVRATGTNATINNLGSISNTGTGGDGTIGAAIGVYTSSGTTVINNGSPSNAAATISGQNAGINHVLRAASLLTINNYGLIKGNVYTGIENQNGSGALTVNNFATGSIVARYNGISGYGSFTITNSGQIHSTDGLGYGIGNTGTLTLTNNGGGIVAGYARGISATTGTITNSGTIGAGSISNGAFVQGSTSAAYQGVGVYLSNGGTVINNSGGQIFGSSNGTYGPTSLQEAIEADYGLLTVTNSGLISGGVWGISTYQAAVNITNNVGGTISGTGTVSDAVEFAGANSVVNNYGTLTGGESGIYGFGAGASATITNTGLIREVFVPGSSVGSATSAIYSEGAGTSITNSGTIDTMVSGGRGITLSGGSGLITNQSGGTISGFGGGAGILLSGATYTVALNAGSTVNGGIDASGTTGTNGYTLAGTLNGNFVGGSGNDTVTLLTGSTLNGTLNGGGGTNALVLDGSGDGTLANGAAGTFTMTGSANLGTVTKTGTGIWTLTGDATGNGISQINAGTGSPAGTLVFNATSNLAAAINVNGATIRATSAGAFGTGTITAIDPTIQYGATGSYANNIVLASTDTVNDSTHIKVDAGVVATLTGQISESGSAQPLVFDGAGTAVLAGVNSYTGTTTVNAGTLALSGGQAIADSNAVVVNSGGTLALLNSETIGNLSGSGAVSLGANTLTLGGDNSSATFAGSATGSGGITKLGSGVFTLAGSNSYTGATTVSGGTLRLGASDRLADNSSVIVGTGAMFDLLSYSDTVGILALAGTLSGTGTLTAGEYDLNGATVNANLGTGNLFQLGGTSTLNGTAAAANVMVNGGSLALGASDRLANTATVVVGANATLNLGANSNTVGLFALNNGTLAGTGTLTAAQYQLTGATVNANLGAGTLFQLGGTSVVNGTSAAALVSVNAGTLTLGASNRLSSTATVQVANGATFNLASQSQAIGALWGNGTVALGSGRLTVGGSTDFGFAGNVTGSGAIDKVGTGTFTLASNLAMTGLLNLNAGTTLFAGSTAGSVYVQGGTLIGAASIAGSLNISSGTVSPGISTQPIAGFSAGSLNVSGGTLAFDLAGSAGNFAADRIAVSGATMLTGGTVVARGIEPSANYKVMQNYLLISSGSLTGTFANGSSFTQILNNPDLQWRLRYDLMPNSVVLELRRQIDMLSGLGSGATGNQYMVGGAFNGGAFTASDNWASILNGLASQAPDQRAATFDSVSGESISDITSSISIAAQDFSDLLRSRLAFGVGASQDAQIAGSARANSLPAIGAGTGFGAAGLTRPRSNGATAWLQGLGENGFISGLPGQAKVATYAAGIAGGIELNRGDWSIGGAFAVSDVESKVQDRSSRNHGTLYQGGGYLAFDNGRFYASGIGSYFSGDIFSSRRVSFGGMAIGAATATPKTSGYSAAGQFGYRVSLGNAVVFTPQASFTATHVTRNAFTETGIGGLSLQAARETRTIYAATGEGRLSKAFNALGGQVVPYIGGGVTYKFGDLDTKSALAFTGAPTGTGTYTINGARLAPVAGLVNVGLDARPNDHVSLGLGFETTLAKRQQEERITAAIRLRF